MWVLTGFRVLQVLGDVGCTGILGLGVLHDLECWGDEDLGVLGDVGCTGIMEWDAGPIGRFGVLWILGLLDSVGIRGCGCRGIVGKGVQDLECCGI